MSNEHVTPEQHSCISGDIEVADWSKLPDSPLVSVWMITYQHADYIREALDGILMQEVDFDYEICLGEDGSTDGTREICLEYAERYPEKIRLFLRDRENPERSHYRAPFMHNMVETLRTCRGKYIAMCEGDDYWADPLKLQKQVDFLNSHSDFSLCFHRSKVLKDGVFQDSSLRVPRQETAIVDVIENPVYIHTHSVVFRNVLGQHDKVFRNAKTGDFIIFALAGEQSKLWCMDGEMGVYRVGDNNSWLGSSILSRMEDFISTQDALVAYFRNEDKMEFATLIEKSQEERLSCICKMHYQDGNVEKLLEYELKLIRNNPTYFYERMKEVALHAQTSLNFVDFIRIKLSVSPLGALYRSLKKRIKT